ncbi:hypothetical protein O1611_g2984 [Lasiodiplodia mahajangana]|uniref:Uncharacterized protein n=1 Tax=Lasiodiplodia mahajangana TaxID=1108764 RepID=A0ACC2JT04_9PEZI|nr:hypothetical protein O1611_g2984 [Lasiodiplodia mahajangana]
MDHFPPAPIIDGYNLREANRDDLDRIAYIHLQGFSEEPMDNYCYPDRFKYKESHLKWLRKEYEYYLDNSNKYLVHVAEPAGHTERVPHQPMALAVWNINVLADVPALGKSPPSLFPNTLLNSVIRSRLRSTKRREQGAP